MIRLYILLFSFILSSCTNNLLKINQDNTAEITIELNYIDPEMIAEEESDDWEDETIEIDIPDSLEIDINTIKSRFDSKSISNLSIKQDDKGNPISISFEITPIDSLGKYLDPFSNIEVETKLKNNQFSLIGPTGRSNPELDRCGCMNLISFKTTLQFEQSIKKYDTPNDYIKQIDEHKIEINTNLGELAFNGIANDLIVWLNP